MPDFGASSINDYAYNHLWIDLLFGDQQQINKLPYLEKSVSILFSEVCSFIFLEAYISLEALCHLFMTNFLFQFHFGSLQVEFTLWG